MPILSVHFYLLLFQLLQLPAPAVVCSFCLSSHTPSSCIPFLYPLSSCIPFLSASSLFLHCSFCILTLSRRTPSSPSPLSFPWIVLRPLIFCLYGPFPTPPHPTQLTPSNSHYFRRPANSPVVHLLSKVYHTEWQENTLVRTHISHTILLLYS